MELLVTEFRKGRAKLTSLFGNDKPENHKDGMVQIIDKSMIEDILSLGNCDILDLMDEIGEHFAKSWVTRQTGHKKYDFFGTQKKSSSGLQGFYMNMINAWKNSQKERQSGAGLPQMVPFEDANLAPDFYKKVYSLYNKLEKARKDLLKTIKSDRIMYKKVEEESGKVAKGGKTNDEVVKIYNDLITGLNTKGVEFVDEKTNKIVEDTKRMSLNSICAGLGPGLIGACTPSIMIFSLPTSLLLTSAGSVLVFSPLGVGFGLFGLLVIGALALGVANTKGVTERLARIKAKRFESKVQEKLKAVINCINEISRFGFRYSRQINKTAGVDFGENPVPAEVVKVVEDFVKAQKELWETYAYGKDQEWYTGKGDGKHISFLRKRANERDDDEVQICKKALARTWTNLKVSPDLL